MTTASSFVETRGGRALISNTAGYEQPLENDGLPALTRLDLTGPALVSLALLRLEGVEAGIRHPAMGVMHSEPIPVATAAEFFEIDRIDALSRSALGGPFDRLRQKLRLGPASVEAGQS